MILKSLHLRGAKGIKYGMGLDELTIDFTKFQPGLIAIIGRNGAGKTTLLENLTPFRTLFSRRGKLQNHFYLADSHRILEFQIGVNHYKAEIYIDTTRDKAGAVLYKNGKDIATAPREYDLEIDKLFLGKSLFEQSLFFGQDTARISDLRAGEAKDFMAKLLRLDMAQALHKRASLYANEALHEHEVKQERQKELITRLEQQEDLNIILEAKQKEIKTFTTALKIHEDELDRIKEELKIIETVGQYENVIDRCSTEIKEWREKIRTRMLQNRSILSEYSLNSLSSQLKELQDSLDPVTQNDFTTHKDLETLRGALNIKKSAFSERLQEAQAMRSEIEAHRMVTRASVEKNIGLIEERIKRAKKVSSIIDEVPCTENIGENCSLLKDAHTSRANLGVYQQQLVDMNQRLQEIINHRKEESDKLLDRIHIINEKFDPIKKELEKISEKIQSFGNVEAHWVIKQQQLKDINNIKHKITTCEEVLIKEKEAFEDFKTLGRGEICKLQERETTARDQIELLLRGKDLEALKVSKVHCIDELEKCNRLILDATTRMGEIQQQIKEVSNLRVELKSIKRATRLTLQTLGDWRVISKAFGKEGIQAFEIKKALPSIVKMMNELLIGELGQKFSLNFRMKRQGTKGQLIDTFDPLITRYEDDQIMEEEVPLTNLSRGERILVFVAMSEAVGVYLRNSIGLDLKTSFVDEADGPLDPTNRFDYLRTRSHVHELCGLHHTFIISQSPDIYDQIPQKLILKEGGIEVSI